KPANVVEAAGIYKLIDFGIAAADAPESAPSSPVRLPDLPKETLGSRWSSLGATRSLGSTGARGTGVGWVSGTPGYIDPGCMAARAPARAARDLCALGVLLFECLAGRLPARAGGGGLWGGVLDGRAPAPPPLSPAEGTPPPLARLVDALLAPDRSLRPSS